MMEPVDFTETKRPVGRYVLKDGSVIEVRVVMNGIARDGNDPTTGFPNYSADVNVIYRLVSFDPTLRHRSQPPEGMTR